MVPETQTQDGNRRKIVKDNWRYHCDNEDCEYHLRGFAGDLISGDILCGTYEYVKDVCLSKSATKPCGAKQ